mgnify:CR=1 FL=1
MRQHGEELVLRPVRLLRFSAQQRLSLQERLPLRRGRLHERGAISRCALIARRELARRKRLGDVVVRPRADALDPGLLSGPRREENDGSERNAGSARIARTSPIPSRRGIIASLRTSAGRCRLNAAEASSSLATGSTIQYLPSNRVRYARMSALSSATRMRALPSRDASIGTSLGFPFDVELRAGQPSQRLFDEQTAPEDVEANRRLARDAFRWEMRRTGRDRDRERRAPAQLAFRRRPRHRGSLTSSVTSASPMPVPSCVVPCCALHAVEALEDARDLVRRDPDAGIANGELGKPVALRRATTVIAALRA